MAGARELLAVVLGCVLGVVLLLAPRAAIRLSVVAGSRPRRRGDYGTDGEIPDTWAWAVRALGLGCLAIAGLIASQLYF